MLVHHTSKLNYRIIDNTVQCGSICKLLLSIHVTVSCSSSEGISAS
jgi:hypothetical protein